MTEKEAEIVAIRALGWLAGDDELWPVFLSATGADAGEVRQRAADPAFLGAVLDFILQRDETVMAFCRAEGLSFEKPMQARAALPGGAQTHWT